MRRRPAHVVRHRLFERRQHPVALDAVERARRGELLVQVAAAHVFLEEPLAERPGALVGVLLRGHELRRDRRRRRGPTETHAGEERLRRRSRLHDDVGAPATRGSEVLVVEIELATRHPRRSRNRQARASSTSAARRSVDMLTPAGFWWSGSCTSSFGLDRRRASAPARRPPQAVVVSGTTADLGGEVAERHQRPEIRRPFDDDRVACVEERLAVQLRALRSSRS